MQKIERNGYTREEILNVLHGAYGSRKVNFRYYVLDSNDNIKDELTKVMGASVSMASFAKIKRTASFEVIEEFVDRYTSEDAKLEDYYKLTLGEMDNG